MLEKEGRKEGRKEGYLYYFDEEGWAEVYKLYLYDLNKEGWAEGCVYLFVEVSNGY